jgi:hypothetical protein
VSKGLRAGMKLAFDVVEARIAQFLERRTVAEASVVAWAGTWLEACGYPGIAQMIEALGDPRRELVLERDNVGMDLRHVSCVFLAPAILRDVAIHGRVFLRNVRHGLFILPFAVRDNQAIGCPVDPSFAVGGVREKNPYAEKLALAHADGLEIEGETWIRLNS